MKIKTNKQILKSDFSCKNGFTLLEVLLSVALISLLAGLAAPVYQTLQTNNLLDTSVNSLVQSLRRAQLLSQASQNDSGWGVKVQSGSIVLFNGVDYASRDIAYDEIYDLPNSITPSDLSEIVYTKLTGLPQNTGTITLTSVTNEVRNIIVNEKGKIDY